MRTGAIRHAQWRFATKSTLLLLMLLVLVVGTAGFAFASTGKYTNTATRAIAPKTIATDGAEQWLNDTKSTPLLTPTPPLDAKHVSISPLFNAYYVSHGTANSLGDPLTFAVPIANGWLQFFTMGALFSPTASTSSRVSQAAKDALTRLITTGVKDQATGVIRLPLLQTLLTVGSRATIGGADSPLTYIDLRQATNPNLMMTASATSEQAALIVDPTAAYGTGVFVSGGMRDGSSVGHMVAQPFWSYLHRSAIAPNGWQLAVGIPLTNALAFTSTHGGRVHHMLVQLFANDGLLFDADASSEQSAISFLPLGLDYIHTFGLPKIKLDMAKLIWSQGDTSVLDHPSTGHEVAQIGQNFPLQLTGNTLWSGGRLWYNVQWSALKTVHTGWVDANAITFTFPGNGAAKASFDALLPDVATYLKSIGPNASAVLYDVTHNVYYTYNGSSQFIVASSMKVPIMLTFFDMVEQQGREPDDNEVGLLTTMIENSNNDSASALFDAVGGADGITAYMQRINVSGLSPDQDSWGYSLITPQAMVDMLTLLYQGKILNDAHRSLAFNLMENVEPDQQVGVGDTAPGGATVAMKDGWVPGPDNQWAMNSSGIVTIGQQTYILSVYTQEQQSLDDGQAIVRHVCSSIASLFSS